MRDKSNLVDENMRDEDENIACVNIHCLSSSDLLEIIVDEQSEVGQYQKHQRS